MDSTAAEIIALQALGFIATDEKAFSGLMASTGIDVDSLKNAGSDPTILVGVLDFLLQNEDRLMAFCDEQSLDPTQPGRAWSTLTGMDMG